MRKKALHACRERELDAQSGRERGSPEQPRPQQRGDPLSRLPPGPPLLDHGQRAQPSQAGPKQRPHPGRPAKLTALEQRVDDGHERAGQQHRTGQVRPTRAPRRRRLTGPRPLA